MGDRHKSPELVKILEEELEQRGSTGAWLWKTFILCITPIILNGFHTNSYVFLAKEPAHFYCSIDYLEQNGWTTDQIRNFTLPNGLSETRGCDVLNYNYSDFQGLGYEDGLKVISIIEVPMQVPCKENNPENFLKYQSLLGESIVSEFGLVCDDMILRSHIQLAISLGKLLGAVTCGFLSDKFGRKTIFVIGGIVYMISGFVTVFAVNYWMLFMGRFGTGWSSAAIFLGTLTLLTENISQVNRTWMSNLFNISFPVGMVTMGVLAYYLPLWRNLQMALTLPALLLFINFYFLDESPRWLISNKRYAEAYQVLFRTPSPATLTIQLEEKTTTEDEAKVDFWSRMHGSLRVLLFNLKSLSLGKHILVCSILWFITSLGSYVTALNAAKGEEVLHVLVVGMITIPCSLVPLVVLRFFGRRIVSSGFLAMAGVFLLMMLAPVDATTKMIFTMFGRFGISSAYDVVILLSTELFPVDVRSSSIGICYTMSHLGAIAAPYIVDLLGYVAPFIPNTICGALALIGSVVIFLLPETRVFENLKAKEVNN